MPRPDVLTRAGETGPGIFGLKIWEQIQFDSESRSPTAGAKELLSRVNGDANAARAALEAAISMTPKL